MKIKEKLKKCITGVGAFFTTITTKVFATDVNSILMEINGASAGEELYGIVNPLQDVYLFSNYVLKICKFLVIPLVLIIGLIVIIQKKEDIKLENLKKAIIIIVDIRKLTASLVTIDIGNISLGKYTFLIISPFPITVNADCVTAVVKYVHGINATHT